MNKAKELIIVRGVPGSGKSSHVKGVIQRDYKGIGFVFSTDDFFIIDSKYRFLPKYLPIAHEWNLQRAKIAMNSGQSPVVIDNTNMQCWEAKPYVQIGLELGYTIIITQPKTQWWLNRDIQTCAKKNTHGVSDIVIQNMLNRWEDDFSTNSIMKSSKPR
jgi:predicted kinase